MSYSRREFLVASTAVPFATAPQAKSSVGLLLYSLGIRSRTDKAKPLAEPLNFLFAANELNAAGVQVPLGVRSGAECDAIRKRAADLGLFVEGIVDVPKDGDVSKFDNQLATAKACGVAVARGVLLGGRRYETFRTHDDFVAFDKAARETLKRIEPIAAKHKVAVAIENHKDYRAAELADAMTAFSSEWLGVCFDAGNNLALLDDPAETAKTLAPWTLTVHLKDMGVDESKDGFLLAEVPLGSGRLDLKTLIATIRDKRPKARLNLEMITRDPLSIPCLTDRYWATMKAVPAHDLARTLAWVRAMPRTESLPRLSRMHEAKQLEVEAENVTKSLAYAEGKGW